MVEPRTPKVSDEEEPADRDRGHYHRAKDDGPWTADLSPLTPPALAVPSACACPPGTWAAEIAAPSPTCPVHGLDRPGQTVVLAPEPPTR